MEQFTTYDKNNYFSLAFSDYCGTEFDNQEALGLRLTLLLVEEGTGIAMIDGHAVTYIAPCVFCIHEKEHCVISKENNSIMKAVYFHPSIVNSSIDFDNLRDVDNTELRTVRQDKIMLRFFVDRKEGFVGRFALGPMAGKRFSKVIEMIHKQSHEQEADNWPCRSRSYIMELLFQLENLYDSGLYENENSIDGMQEEFYPILLYVYHNYDKKMTVAEMTDQFHISRTTFAQMFQKNVGESFLTYLNKLRITIASTMLRDTLLPVSEIMFRVGFTDQVHFLRTFKKLTTMTPTAYREKYNWM